MINVTEGYFYKKGFIHAKTACIDGKLAYIGTVNLDIRSFFINYEIAAIISDDSLCAAMTAQFERDKEDCELMTLKQWKKRKASMKEAFYITKNFGI